MLSDEQYARAAENVPEETWFDNNGNLVLPLEREKFEGISIGAHLNNASNPRRDNPHLQQAYLGEETAEVLRRRGFKDYLERHENGKWILNSNTPKRPRRPLPVGSTQIRAVPVAPRNPVDWTTYQEQERSPYGSVSPLANAASGMVDAFNSRNAAAIGGYANVMRQMLDDRARRGNPYAAREPSATSRSVYGQGYGSGGQGYGQGYGSGQKPPSPRFG
jgi:hypothetical protein